MRLNTTLLVLASFFLLQGNSSFLIRANISSNGLDSNVVLSQQYGGGSPPPLTRKTACGCKRILLSSLGPAAQYQPQAMGIYEVSYTSYNSHPSYRQNRGADRRLYFLPNGWLVGDKRGAPTGYIHNSDTSQLCPYTITSPWLFFSVAHNSWYQDNTLVLRCADMNYKR